MKETANISSTHPILSGSLSPFLCSNVATLAETSSMAETELNGIVNCLDDALDVYRLNEGRLTAMEISIKSKLIVVRTQILSQIFRAQLALPASGTD